MKPTQSDHTPYWSFRSINAAAKVFQINKTRLRQCSQILSVQRQQTSNTVRQTVRRIFSDITGAEIGPTVPFSAGNSDSISSFAIVTVLDDLQTEITHDGKSDEVTDSKILSPKRNGLILEFFQEHIILKPAGN